MGWLIYISLCSLLPSSVVFAAFNPCETCDYEGAEKFCPEKCNKNVKNQSHLTDCDFEYAEVFNPLCAKTSTASLEESKTSDVTTCSENGKKGRCVKYNQCNSYKQNSNYGFGIIAERFADICASDEICCEEENIKRDVTICSENGKEGLCVKYNQCNSNDHNNNFGFGIIAERFAETCEPTETCCEEENIKKDVPKCSKNDKEGLCVPHNQCNAGDHDNNYGFGLIAESKYENSCYFLEKCCTKTVKSNTIPLGERMQNAKPKLCGERNKNGTLFSITSVNSEAQFGEFPWMLFLYAQEKPTDTSLYICGGSLIHPKVAITAAHCIKKVPNKSKLYVRAGDWDTGTENEPLPHKNVKVDKIIIHDKFYKGGLHNDLAILILESPIEESDHIGVICLPPPIEVQPRPNCVSTGWGKKATEKGDTLQNILKKIDLPIVSYSSCQLALRKTRLGIFFKLHESFMCAGGKQGKDTCKGDGGSPLICPIPNDPTRYMQVGIVAWGIGCGEENIPGVYANIPYMRSWILSQLKQNNIDMSRYEN